MNCAHNIEIDGKLYYLEYTVSASSSYTSATLDSPEEYDFEAELVTLDSVELYNSDQTECNPISLNKIEEKRLYNKLGDYISDNYEGYAQQHEDELSDYDPYDV